MDYEVSEVDVAAQRIAGVRAEVPMAQLASLVRSLLDDVWVQVRANNARFIHNVIVYWSSRDDERGLVLDATFGVQVEDEVPAAGRVAMSETPAGRALTARHTGSYDGLRACHQTIDAWAAQRGLRLAGPRWEVYGDWSDNPAKVFTDVFCLLAAA